jgi:hypothetical protein
MFCERALKKAMNVLHSSHSLTTVFFLHELAVFNLETRGKHISSGKTQQTILPRCIASIKIIPVRQA